MKFLVIRFSSIGDIVVVSPVLRSLKTQILTAEVHFLTKLSLRKVSEANPYIDKCYHYDNNLSELTEKLKEEKYDYVIDLQRNLRSARVRKSLGVKAYKVDKLNLEKMLLTIFHVDVIPRRHTSIRSLDTLAEFGIRNDGGGLDYFIPEQDRIGEHDIPASHQAGYIAIVIGASYYTKKLPPDKLRELCSSIDHPIMLLGGQEDRLVGDFISQADPVRIYNSCGKFNINESADLVRRSKLVISHDTGLQHMASAFRKPLLAIWGGTSPKLTLEPYYGEPQDTGSAGSMHENILVPGLTCQPCSRHGRRRCPLGHFNCMEQMDIAHIVSRVNARLGR